MIPGLWAEKVWVWGVFEIFPSSDVQRFAPPAFVGVGVVKHLHQKKQKTISIKTRNTKDRSDGVADCAKCTSIRFGKGRSFVCFYWVDTKRGERSQGMQGCWFLRAKK